MGIKTQPSDDVLKRRFTPPVPAGMSQSAAKKYKKVCEHALTLATAVRNFVPDESPVKGSLFDDLDDLVTKAVAAFD